MTHSSWFLPVISINWKKKINHYEQVCTPQKRKTDEGKGEDTAEFESGLKKQNTQNFDILAPKAKH